MADLSIVLVAAADQAISNLRAIIALNDDPHIDQIARATADLLGIALLGVDVPNMIGETSMERPLCPRGKCIPHPAKNKPIRTEHGDRIVGQCKVCGVTLIMLPNDPRLPRKSTDDDYRETIEQADHERPIEHRGEWY